MAQAGFYHQPNSSGDDRAMCFTCTVCLVCWERTDEPCSEHERHSPNCPFVIGEYTQNVPFNVPHLVPTANSDGLISVFDVTGKAKRAHSFYVTQFDSFILDKFTQDFGQAGIWSVAENKKYPVEKKVTSLCIVSDKSSPTNAKPVRSTLLCGLSLTSQSEKQPEMAMDSDRASETRLYLVAYDFLYSKEQEEAENEIDFGAPELPGYNLMKQLSSFYKSFVPGESDEVFLPPTLTAKKPHSGPRVLLFDEADGGKTDSSSSGQPMTNGQMAGLDCDLSISDHITEVGSSLPVYQLSMPLCE
ncbi:unnamed protein product [Phaedon cochleariae]|uniref:Uncharacterized protein n=1 Tax=Phaedon cochleariae TaxID=80249 RepID=A0A9N9X2G3_PHACE|nr:unnamed protein product [Phaedon cochleariae]